MILKIYNDICTDRENELRVMFGDAAGTSFGSIDEFIAGIPADDPTIDLYINCPGGVISEGWAIVDKLRSTGKTITATIDGRCDSMAVSVLLAASVRKAQPHATLHIHRPYYPEYTLADSYDANELQKLADGLRMEGERMLDWYVERTGADRAELSALMDEDKDIPIDEAIKLGFVQSIVEPASASTRKKEWESFNHQNNTNMSKNTNKASLIKGIASMLGLAVNIEGEEDTITIDTADGRQFTIFKAEGEPAVGDKAEPDGEFPLEDGRIVKIEDGVITEIVEAVEPENSDEEQDAEDIEAIKQENEALKAENDELKKKVEELEAKVTELEKEQTSAEDKSILTTVNKCGGKAWLNRVASSNYKPATRQTASQNAGKVNGIEARIAELEARVNKKK